MWGMGCNPTPPKYPPSWEATAALPRNRSLPRAAGFFAWPGRPAPPRLPLPLCGAERDATGLNAGLEEENKESRRLGESCLILPRLQHIQHICDANDTEMAPKGHARRANCDIGGIRS